MLFLKMAAIRKRKRYNLFNLRKVYFASLLSVSVLLKNEEHFQQRHPDQVEFKISTPQFPKVYREILRNNSVEIIGSNKKEMY